MKKRLLLVSLALAVIIAGVVAVQAASRTRSFKITNGKVTQKLSSSRDKTIKVKKSGKTYTIYLKKFSSNTWSITSMRKCTRSNFTSCTKVSRTWKRIKKNDRVKVKGTYYKASKRYLAKKKLYYYRPPTSGYGY